MFQKYKDGSDFDGMAIHSSGNIFTSGPGNILLTVLLMMKKNTCMQLDLLIILKYIELNLSNRKFFFGK